MLNINVDNINRYSSISEDKESFNLTINIDVQGRKKTERLWGPRFMEKGTYKLKFPENKIINGKGKCPNCGSKIIRK